jgi:hypothetical protein
MTRKSSLAIQSEMAINDKSEIDEIEIKICGRLAAKILWYLTDCYWFPRWNNSYNNGCDNANKGEIWPFIISQYYRVDYTQIGNTQELGTENKE